jgi:SAM-dependent methyltransferase/uncharacterized protein YbaR (Trm112 family)
MRLIHYEALKPVCPHCKIYGEMKFLKLQTNETNLTEVHSGILACDSVSCGRKYPIIFGCPILVPDVQSWLTTNLHLVLNKNIVDENVESLIGETVPSDTFYNIIRQQQSSYCSDHYADEFSPPNLESEITTTSTIRRCLDMCLQHMPRSQMPCVDIGCAVGGTSFEIARNRNVLTLGIDLNWPLLDIPRTIISDGVISYPHRIIGNRYTRRTSTITYPNIDSCDFWIADASCMPFRSDTFGTAIGLNIIDCMNDPEKLLREILSITTSDAGVSMSCPFDWTSQATNQNQWIYGDEELDKILIETSLKTVDNQKKAFVNLCPPQYFNWSLPLHERAKMTYLARLYIMKISIS